jgi:DNA-binding response OmpR family regulator
MPLGRVLVVDDELQVGALLQEALVDFGYLVKTAVSGVEALGLMPVFQPYVVLLDVGLPGMSGQAVLAQLRREYPRVPIVMVTGNQDEDTARQMLAAGAFDYIPKPFDLGVLERVVGAAVASRRG